MDLIDEVLAGVYRAQPPAVRDDLRALANDRLLEEDVRRARATLVLAGTPLKDILTAERQHNNGNNPQQPDPDDDPRRQLIDWTAFWTKDPADEEWIAWPLLPAKRQVAIYAPAKAGKSLLILDIVAAVATGQPILGQPNPAGPRHVLYLDYEMTTDDLRERLEDMGYGPDDDLEHLHYASLPTFDALNRPEGAKAVLDLAQAVQAELVIVDTLARAVEGDENDADTVNDFYRWTGLALKAHGIALARIDHAGKDLTKGQRGSSAKAADVDIVWELTRADGGLLVKRTHSRLGWIQETVAVGIITTPTLHHTVTPRIDPAGTNECVTLLDNLNLPADSSSRTAQTALRQAGTARSRPAVLAALRIRRERDGIGLLLNQYGPGTSTGTSTFPTNGTSTGNGNGENGSEQGRNQHRNQQKPAPESRGCTGSHVVGTSTPDLADEDF